MSREMSNEVMKKSKSKEKGMMLVGRVQLKLSPDKVKPLPTRQSRQQIIVQAEVHRENSSLSMMEQKKDGEDKQIRIKEDKGDLVVHLWREERHFKLLDLLVKVYFPQRRLEECDYTTIIYCHSMHVYTTF